MGLDAARSTGLRNIAIRSLATPDSRGDAGELAENAIFADRCKKSPLLEQIGFWRTQSKNEVDFILQQAERVRPVVLTRDYFGGKDGVTISF